MGARPTHDIVRHKDVPIVRLEDPGYKQYSSSIAWLKEFAEGMNEEIEQDKKSHSEYVSKFDNAIAEVMQLRKFGSK